jgi:hypothetical protein
LLQDIYHKENLRLTVEQWIDQSVITQCLSKQLSCIENDLDLLEYYYYSKKLIEILFFFLLFSADWNRHSYDGIFKNRNVYATNADDQYKVGYFSENDVFDPEQK